MFNPPFSKNVSTNVAKKFLSLINKHCSKSPHLHSCTENIGTFIQRQNAKIPIPTHNCRKKEDCSLNGECQTTSIIYKCIVTAPNVPTKTYIGLTEKEFKTRWNNHKQSINNKKYKNSTSLSAHVWEIKEKHGLTPTLTWSIVKHAKSYTPNSRNCSLCMQKKFEI